MWDAILQAFGIDSSKVSLSPIHQGLINNTWKVNGEEQSYILQRINENVFSRPEDISFNISSIASYLKEFHPEYYFVAPLIANNGLSFIKNDDGYYRMFSFVENSFTRDTVTSADEAFEAARQFGKFTAVLHGFDSSKLRTTIPGFHDLSLRYQQFLLALEHGNQERRKEAVDLVKQLKSRYFLVEEYEKIKHSKEFKLRTTHHDTKISNVMFDKSGKGICVIDLDTVMPGYFISDVGDMMRTYLCPVSEEERDPDKIMIRPGFYKAIVEGYQSEMQPHLTSTESKYIFYAGAFMIYMQALRFLTDHINNDIYYGAAYPGHNFARAQNQLTLLQRFEALKDERQ
jgi:Ser/Thr protein kinase RdoA (MazF antagonist)